MSKEPPPTREQGPREQCKSPEGGAWNRVTVLICLCPHLPIAGISPSRSTAPGECENCTSGTTGRETDRERCKESASQCKRHRSKEREECAAREPKRAWIFLEIVGDFKVSQVNASTAFFIWFLKMTIKERGFVRMSEDVEATIWRLRETVRVTELAAMHRLGQMRRLLMHEKHKAWKREFGFDRI